MSRKKHSFVHSLIERHGLSIVGAAILSLWVVLYSLTDEHHHWGAFFGNAIADWSGVMVVILGTKFLYERGSPESKEPGPRAPWRSHVSEFIREHSLTLFLLATGAGWIVLFAGCNPDSKWGQVVGNIVSEWGQMLGLVLMSKKLIEAGSKESAK
jgi:hypothetical protein